MKWDQLARRAKSMIDKRGGTDALKKDMEEVRDIAKGEGDIKTKAKKAAEALKDPGATGSPAPPPGPDRPAADVPPVPQAAPPEDPPPPEQG